MKIAVTGASGLIGSALGRALTARGDEVVALSRDRWDPLSGAAPPSLFKDVSAVVHLAGEPVAQRWSEAAKERIRTSRVLGTSNLVTGLRSAGNIGPDVLVCASAAGYYGDRGDEVLDESAAPGDDFLASVCVDWEREAMAAHEFGMRVVVVRTGVVLDGSGGALPKMLPPFKLGIGGPIAGGRQYVPWVALQDIVGMYLAALDGEGWTGAVNGCAPNAATNAELSKALGRALHRPAVMPVPALALKALYGEMASVVLSSQRMVPAHAVELGYEFRCAELDAALAASL